MLLRRLGFVAAVAAQQHLGPAAFLWPPDRVWGSAAGHTAPCGSVTGVGNRTEFPLRNARVALVAQDDSWDAQIAIAFRADPKSDADFSLLTNPSFLRNSDPGHSCLAVADAAPSARAGDKATLQIRYSSGYDDANQEFLYACTDIIFVRPERFRPPSLSCFNASVVETDYDDMPWPDGFAAPADDGDDGRLSGGAIAGIVVAAVSLTLLLLTAALLLYRRRQQRSRSLRQQNSLRAVKWDEQAAARGPDSPVNVKLRDLS
ncbi:putative GPI anchored protein [Ophiocordyceps camponoti-floridani]|uniref:Putative GPI anchored protein n=1 Tax=Ophiocordyceps camponoti-floridani TaxID=2030778 RepID=A0A8H4VD30_9HYPO|nr:putative GPI anchored protein [Ophiocordyceps camponoti-floridani]